MVTAYLLTGSNLGERVAFLHKANLLIEQICGKIVQQSAIYETAPWGYKEQPAFLNQVIAIKTNLSAEMLMSSLLKIEETIGRIRTIKLGPRIIDLDILMYDQVITESPYLQLPHPALHLRKFALIPFAEIAPDLLHPVFNKTISALLNECPDDSNVQKKIDLPV
jgi:2-amino-4-hydroxy-6-hydroxymethyldihydropteridine diphosphokinase